MKHIQIILLCLLLLFSAGQTNAQSVPVAEVSGTVVDTQGRPLNGVQVRGEDGTIAATDRQGLFTLRVPAGSQLIFSALGYQSQQIESARAAAVTLVSDTERVNVAFRTVAPEDVTGGVAYLNIPQQLEKVNFFGGGDNLTEMMPGYGTGAVWGMGGLTTLVDGVPRDLGNVMASEIEQITLLKGAAAVALYGSRGAKGVLLVTTKRGDSQRSRIEVRGNTSIALPKIFPEYLGSGEYMSLYNEARANDGLELSYSDEMIYNYASGINPYRYPSVDYYSSDYLRKMSTRTDATLEFTGGNERARYYANMGFYNTNSLLKVGEGANDRVNRFHVRGNIDVKLNKFITSKVNTSLVFYNTRTARGDYWNNAASLRPNRYTPLIPIDYLEQSDGASQDIVRNTPFLIDGKYLLGGMQQQTTNPFADLYTQGPDQYRARQFQFDAAVNFDLGMVLKGLSFNTQFGVDYYSRFNQQINNNTYAVYEPIWYDYAGGDEGRIAALTQYNVDAASRGRSISNTYQYQNIFLSAQLDYRRTFGGDHNVSAILLAHGYQRTESAIYHRVSNANLGFLASYNYRHKYYVDFAGNAVHSAKLPEGNRMAVSPTVTLGWRLSGENFLAGSRAVDNLMLTVTGGVLNTDLDISDYYMYQAIWRRGSPDFQWHEGRQINQTFMTRGGNPDLGFIQRREISAGLDASLFEGLVRLNASWFHTRLDGLVITDTNRSPAFFTSNDTNLIPYINNDNNLYTGFDFGVSLNKRIGEVDFDLGVVGAYFVPEVVKRSENYEYAYQSRMGRPINSLWGLVSDGIFQNKAEIDAHATQSWSPKPGDIRYVDQNDDNVIDGKDEVWLGRSTPPFYYGINLTARWKNFTFFAQARGQAGGQGLKNSTYYHVYGDRKYSAVVRDRTIIEKVGTDPLDWQVVQQGSFPRLTTQSGDNNFRNSDYWLYKNDRIDLTRVQLSYELPKRLFTDASIIKGINVYVSGYDLLTISKERKVLEMNIGSAPQTRSFNAGVKVTF